MRKIDQKNILHLVSSKGISRIGDIMFDFANNTFLASLNPTSLSLVAVYQSLESIIGVLFNLFGGVIADRFNRKKLSLQQIFYVVSLVSFFPLFLKKNG